MSVLPLGIKLSAPNQPEPAKTVPVKSPAPQPETHYVPGRQLGFDEYVDLSQKVADAGENKNRAIMSTQRNLNRKLQKELMPAVKAILNPANPPAEIVLGSDYSSPEWNEVTMDDGRGLPVAYRYRLNVSADPAKPDIRKMSLITFLEYHPQRQRFEVVNAQDGVVNDAVRILIETEPKQSGEKRGFIGASFQVKVNQGEVVDIQPITYFTEQGEVAPANPRGKEMPEVLSPAHCIECHGREDDYFFRMNFEQQRTSYQPGQTVDRFINAMTKKGVPGGSAEKPESLPGESPPKSSASHPTGLVSDGLSMLRRSRLPEKTLIPAASDESHHPYFPLALSLESPPLDAHHPERP